VPYRRLSEAEHGWNHTRMLLDITRKEVDARTHEIIHLEHHVEMQDTELEERVETIANLEQQLLRPRGDRCHAWHRRGLGLITIGFGETNFEWIGLV
jgi:hypothetical protein